MNFLIGVYVGGIIVHCVVFRGREWLMLVACLIWPLLALRGFIDDVMETRR